VTILHIDSSITGDHSVSRRVSKRIVEQLQAGDPRAKVVRRDLAADPLPHLELTHMADGTVVDEFMAADTVVIGAPMYNWNVPSQLKAWLDRILVAGRTFAYTEQGPMGLATGKRVIVAVSRGGLYGEASPMRFLEHVETYLRGVFGIIGIDPEFIIAEGMKVGPEQEHEAISSALAAAELVARAERLAA
jgi:FMN-dependent NADH-azoreductase